MPTKLSTHPMINYSAVVRATFIRPVLGTISTDLKTFGKYLSKGDIEEYANVPLPENMKQIITGQLDKFDQVIDGQGRTLAPDIEAKSSDEVKADADLKKAVTDEVEKLTPTAFYLHKFNGDEKPSFVMRDYQIKGAFKGAMLHLRKPEIAWSNAFKFFSSDAKVKSFVAQTLFIKPIFTKFILPEGEEYSWLMRPAKVETQQGPRTCLLVSLQAPAGTTIEFSVHSMDPRKVTQDVIKEAMTYWGLSGFLQWRSAGYGQATVEILEEDFDAKVAEVVDAAYIKAEAKKAAKAAKKDEAKK